MATTKKVTDLKAWLAQQPRCLGCKRPMLKWDADLDALARQGLYDEVAYVMRGDPDCLCKTCEVDEELAIALLYQHECDEHTWQQLFRHAVRLCVRGMKLA